MNIFERVAKRLKREEESAFEGNPISGDFFEISHSTDAKVIGRKFPQTDFIELSIAHAIKFHEIQTANLKFNEIRLYPSSKLTDCVSTAAISAHGFLLSERALDIFKKFHLGTHKTFPAKMKFEGQNHSYFYLQIKNDTMQSIDFKRSSFYIVDTLSVPVKDFEINNEQEYNVISKKIFLGEMDEIEEYSSLNLKKAVFLKDARIPDFFTIDACRTTLFITQRLNDRIIEAGLTGFEITPTKRIVIEG